MTLAVTHNFVSAVTPAGDPGEVTTGHWNEEHVIVSGALSVLARAENSTGAVIGLAAGANDRLLRRAADVLEFGQLTVGMFPDSVVTYEKIQNVSATDKLLGRSSSGAGAIEEIACTAAGRAILDDPDVSAQRTTLGLGTAAVKNTGTSGDAVPLLNVPNTWGADQSHATTFKTHWYNTADQVTNYERGFVRWTSNALQIGMEAAGTGVNRHIGFYHGSTERFRVATNGNMIFLGGADFNNNGLINVGSISSAVRSTNATGGVGYNTGAGGTVTQLTNKSTGVTLNKVVGQITMNNAALADATTVSFTLTNSAIAAADAVIACHSSAGTAGAYLVSANALAAGSCAISVRNVSGGSLSEAIVLTFAVIKGATA